MNHLLKIISQDINTLNSLVEHLMDKEEVNSLEIDLALRKVNDVYNELLMLKPDSDKTMVKLSPEKESIELVVKEKPVVPEVVVFTEKETAAKDSIVEVNLIEEEEEVKRESLISETDLNKEVKVYEKEIGNSVVEEQVEKEPREVQPKEQQIVETRPEPIILEEVQEKEIINDVAIDVVPEEPLIEDMVSEEVLDTKETDEPIAAKVVNTNTLADKFSDTAPSLNDIQAGINKHKYLAAQFNDKPIDKLSSVIKINDRIWFINELFNKDASSYTAALSKIDAMSNLDDALAYIFENFNWDQEKKSTIAFLELVFRRFAQQN